MTFPVAGHRGTETRIAKSIGKRAIALAAVQSGLSAALAARRAGVSMRQMRRYLRSDWRPGA